MFFIHVDIDTDCARAYEQISRAGPQPRSGPHEHVLRVPMRPEFGAGVELIEGCLYPKVALGMTWIAVSLAVLCSAIFVLHFFLVPILASPLHCCSGVLILLPTASSLSSAFHPLLRIPRRASSPLPLIPRLDLHLCTPTSSHPIHTLPAPASRPEHERMVTLCAVARLYPVSRSASVVLCP